MMRMEVSGLAELGRSLRELETELAVKLLRASTSVAAATIRKEAEARAPFRTGTTRRAIYIYRDSKNSGRYQQVFLVGVRMGKRFQQLTIKTGKRKGETINADAYYAKFLEYGTRRMAKRPFMRPAFDNKREAAVEGFKKRMVAGLKRFGLR